MANQAWIDTEETGFTRLHSKDVYKHKILEIACVISDDKLEIVDEINLVIGHDIAEAQSLADDVVIAMHTANGLWADCARSTLTLEQAEAQLIEFLGSHGIGPRETALWGNGLHHDRSFIEAQMPKLDGYLHYRNPDVSGMKELIKLFSPELEPKKKLAHRALGDVKESLAEAKYYLDIIRPSLEVELQRIRSAKLRAEAEGSSPTL